MKQTFISRSAPLATLLASLVVSGCMTDNNKTDGEYDKYKNTEVNQTTAQASLSAQMDYMQNWDDATQNPVSEADIPGTGGSADWPTMQKASAMSKTAADDPMVVDSSTKSQGYITLSVRRPMLLQTTYDTAVVKWDAKAQDSVKGNENVIRWSHTVVYAIGGSVDRAAYTDDDGDGIVNVVAGRENRIRIEFTKSSTRTDGRHQVETAVVIASPGTDNNFDTEADNRLYQADWNRKADGALLAMVTFTDDDGDGVVLDNAKASVVKMTAWESAPPLRPRVQSVGAVVRVRKLGFGLGEEPVGFTYNDTLKNGRTDKVYVKNSTGGEDIRANDTLRVFFETQQRNGDDSLRSAKVEIALNLGSNLKSDADDVFYSLNAESHNRLGFERDVKLAVVSSMPVPRGQQPKNGTFSFDVTYANLKTISVVGTFTPASLDGVYTGPDGATAVFHLNR